MPILTQADILAIHEKAVQLGFHNRRQAMMTGIPLGFVGIIDTMPDPISQQYVDLGTMNADINLVLAGGVTPLATWLGNAAAFSSQYPPMQALFSNLATQVAGKAAHAGGTPGDNGAAVGAAIDNLTLPQKIVNTSDLLPAGFLDKALATARGVVRIVVPVYSGPVPQLWPNGQAKRGFGTGWMLGPRHLLTNNHVIVMRAPGDMPASEAEVRLQAEHAIAEFDYLDEMLPPSQSIPITAITATDAILDYALLELQSAVTDRLPLRLASVPMLADPANPAAVNIVQHPRGAPKQVALRNNLVAALNDKDLAYYTDTEGGSSGSPVTNDAWEVVALHKATTVRFGTMQFQGKDTAWVNIGTPIGLIVEDIKTKIGAAAWAAIGATFA